MNTAQILQDLQTYRQFLAQHNISEVPLAELSSLLTKLEKLLAEPPCELEANQDSLYIELGEQEQAYCLVVTMIASLMAWAETRKCSATPLKIEAAALVNTRTFRELHVPKPEQPLKPFNWKI